MFAAHRKSITAFVGAIIGWVSVVLTSTPDAITGAEWLGLGIGLATAAGVYGAKNA